RPLVSSSDIREIFGNFYVEVRSRLNCRDVVDLPASQSASHKPVFVFECRKVINEAGHKPVAYVPVRASVIAVPIVRVHGKAAVIRIGRDIQRMRPGVTRKDLDSVLYTLPKNRRQTVIIGDFVILNRTDSPPELIRATGLHGARSKYNR